MSSTNFLPSLMLGVIAILLIAAVTFFKASGGKGKSKERPKPRRPLTANEQKLYFRLQQVAPDLVVLPQVSFSALMTARSWATRNTFNRKRADFVLCDRAFNVLAVIELDDSSHDGREKQDVERDALLAAAGYKVLRWRGIPDSKEVFEKVSALRSAPTIPSPPPGVLAEL